MLKDADRIPVTKNYFKGNAHINNTKSFQTSHLLQEGEVIITYQVLCVKNFNVSGSFQ